MSLDNMVTCSNCGRRAIFMCARCGLPLCDREHFCPDCDPDKETAAVVVLLEFSSQPTLSGPYDQPIMRSTAS